MLIRVALTEVLKIVAEDRASATIARVSSVAQSQFGASKQSADRFAKALSGYVVESVVGFAKTGAAAFAAFGVASVAALGAFAFKAVEAQIAYDRFARSYSGRSTPLLGATDSLAASFDRFQGAVASLVVEGTNLVPIMNAIALALDRMLDGASVSRIKTFADTIKSMTKWLAPFMGPLSGFAAGAMQFLDAAQLAAKAISGSGDGTMRLSPVMINLSAMKDMAKADAEREKAMDAAVGRLNPMDDAAIANRARDLRAEAAAMRAAEVERQMRDLEELGEKQAQEREKINEANKQKAEDAKRVLDELKAKSQETAAQIGHAASAVGGLFAQIVRGGMKAEDVLLSVLGTVLSIAASIFVPGGGATASGIFGFLGSIFGFQDGGVIHAARGMRVPGVGSGDRVPAMLEPGETVVPKGGTHPSFIDEVARAAGGGGGNVTVNLSQGYLVPPDSVTAQRNYQRGLIPVLQDLHSTGRGSVTTNPRFRGRKSR